MTRVILVIMNKLTNKKLASSCKISKSNVDTIMMILNGMTAR